MCFEIAFKITAGKHFRVRWANISIVAHRVNIGGNAQTKGKQAANVENLLPLNQFSFVSLLV